jgi:hypothetical protein
MVKMVFLLFARKRGRGDQIVLAAAGQVRTERARRMRTTTDVQMGCPQTATVNAWTLR